MEEKEDDLIVYISNLKNHKGVSDHIRLWKEEGTSFPIKEC